MNDDRAGDDRPGSIWTARYDTDAYVFGTEPAAFLAAQAPRLPPGSRVLCVADGEGRNSTYLAELGHKVTAFDPAATGLKKARRLAADRGVEVAYHLAGVQEWDWREAAWDAVVAVFIQFLAPGERAKVFADMAATLRPGGVLLLHGYAPRQVGYGTGGPPWPNHLYTLTLLHDAFAGWEILHAADYDAEIAEGTAHVGPSALIDFVARKPGG